MKQINEWTQMSRRDESLRSFAHMIAVRFQKMRKHFAGLGEEVTSERLADTFLAMCLNSDNMNNGPLSTREIAIMAEELVPAAVAELDERIAA
jgi:hypothetical protein